MTLTEKKESKTGSKSNLNESTLPLLDEPDNGKSGENKDAIELEAKGTDAGENNTGKKGKKEKKVKEPKEKKERTSPLVAAQNFTVGLNVVDRDDKRINAHVNLSFDDILAETDSSQGFEFIWRLTFLIFTTVRLWLYRIVSAVIALPLALLWAVVFSVINVSVIWILTPFFKVFDVVLFHVHRVYAGLIRTFLDPIFSSFGLLLSNIRSTQTRVSSEISAV